MKRYYEILGVASRATQEEIKEAWLFSIKAFHPDKFSRSSRSQQEIANKRTKAINEAYAVLSDPIRRAEYDRERVRGADAASSPPPPPGPKVPANKGTRARKSPLLYTAIAFALIVFLAIVAHNFVNSIPSARPNNSAVRPASATRPDSTGVISAQATLPTSSSQGRNTDRAEAAKRVAEVDRLRQGIIQDSLVKPTRLTREEKELLDKGQSIEMAGGRDTHSGHMILQLKVGDNKKEVPSVCFVFGMEDVEPARKEGESMAQFRYTRAQAEQFLFAQGWDKYHDRFFTRYYVQEGLGAYEEALDGKGQQARKAENSYINNPDLPADAIELASTEALNPSDFYGAPPKQRPENVPSDYSLTRVFKGGTFVGWVYMSDTTVAALHRSSQTPSTKPLPPTRPPNQEAAADGLLRAAAADYVTSGNAESLDVEMAPYAQQVDYYDQGTKNRDEIRADLAKQRQKWTLRRYEFSRVVRTEYDPAKDVGSAIVRYTYRVSNGPKHREGEAESLIVFSSVTKGPKVIVVKEHKIH